MSAYLLIKSVHMLCAVATILLFTLRLGLDLADQPWRRTALRWIPHANDTVLLAAAIGLCFITGWMPLVHHWLTAKVVLLIAYIFAGMVALNQQASSAKRISASLLAFLLIGTIFYLAWSKPGL
jgi:uncharacterized membrane protein SirB2